MAVDYKTRKSAPLAINGYTSVVTLLRDQFRLDIREIDRRQEWIKEEAPKNWNHYIHAQIHSQDGHIGDIVGINVFALVTYNGFPQEALESIVSKGYLTRGLTTPKEGGPIEIHPGFK